MHRKARTGRRWWVSGAVGKFGKFAVRDGALIFLTVLGWIALSGFSAGEGLLPETLTVLLGVMGGLCAWVLHEWGHVLGAMLGRSKLRVPTKLFSVYLFGFDNKAHTRGQFVVMALGGFVATGLAFAFVMLALPQDLLATKVARGLVLLEIAVTAVLEVPGLILGIIAYEKLPSVDVLGK